MISCLLDKFKKHKLIVIVLMIIMAALSFTSAISGEGQVGGFTGHLDGDVPEMMDHYEIPGASIGIIEAGELRWKGFYGYADIEGEREITEDTYFRVESISKSVTAWGVMKLVEDGMIDLDEPITKYIREWSFPESRFSYDTITTRHLLTHTSGMPLGDFLDRYSPEGEVPSLEESLGTKAIPMAEPGKGFTYSNTGYNLLELLVEEVTGRDFAEYMKEKVLGPLGMDNSTYDWGDLPEGSVPTGYDMEGTPVESYVYPEKASGGMFATLEDVAAFMIAGMGEEYGGGKNVLTSKSLDQLYRPAVESIGIYGLVFDGYGMGYYLEDLSNGQRSVANGGQGGGVMTYFHYVPETGEGIVILTNSQRSWPFFGRIIDDWARWNGYEGAGFGKILMAENILWIIIVILSAAFLIRLYMLSRGLVKGELSLSPSAPLSRTRRIPSVLISAVTLMGLMWAVNQDYLFITAVFPIASSCLGAAMLLLALEQLFLAFSIED
ncbi:MAG: beta-lactamase family protein [Gudongella sp.]|nr:beta-lactamase family protein [Gudongella sp.]